MIRSLAIALSLPILVLTAVFLIEKPGLENPFGKILESKPSAATVNRKSASLDRSEPMVRTSSYETEVEDAGETLSIISLRVYGTSKRWKEIADLNGLKAPYAVRLKQKLRLPQAPSIDPVRGRVLVFQGYRKKFGLPLEGPDYEKSLNQLMALYGKTSNVPIVLVKPTRPVEPKVEPKKEPSQPILKPLEAQNAFEKDGVEILKKKDWKAAIAHFSKRSDGFLKKPNDEKTIWYSGTLAEVVFNQLEKRSELTNRQIASGKVMNKGSIQGWNALWNDQLVCFNVPTRSKRLDGFGYRCIGYQKP